MRKATEAQLKLIRDLRVEINQLDQNRRKFYVLPGDFRGAMMEIDRLMRIKEKLK
jgi:hypothetical protein